MLGESLDILALALARLDRRQHPLHPGQPVAAGRAPAAGFLGEKMLEIAQHADRAGAVIEHDDVARAQPAAEPSRPPSKSIAHIDIVRAMIKPVEAPPGSTAAQFVAVLHAAGMFFENFAQGRAHRQFPERRAADPPAHAVNLGSAVSAYGRGR